MVLPPLPRHSRNIPIYASSMLPCRRVTSVSMTDRPASKCVAESNAIRVAETKAEDLLALIEDILEVARIEEATISLSLAPIAPGALLAELIHEWGHRFQQERTTTEVNVADDAPVFSGDKNLIKRVF